MRAFAPAIAWTAVATGVLAATSAAAQDRGRLPPGVVGYVTADSRFSGPYEGAAPVRPVPENLPGRRPRNRTAFRANRYF